MPKNDFKKYAVLGLAGLILLFALLSKKEKPSAPPPPAPAFAPAPTPPPTPPPLKPEETPKTETPKQETLNQEQKVPKVEEKKNECECPCKDREKPKEKKVAKATKPKKEVKKEDKKVEEKESVESFVKSGGIVCKGTECFLQLGGVRYQKGDTINGWKIESISIDEIRLRKGEEEKKVKW